MTHIEKGDELEVACLEFADRLEIYGIRNHTDGSVYLARTALVASARWELACVPILLGASLLLAGICYALGMDPGTVVEWSLILGIAAPACILVLGAIARVFGWVLMPEVRGHAQSGGRREMNAAREALSITQENRHHVRFI